MQTIIVCLTVIAAVGYLARRIYRNLRQDSDPCANCSGCILKDKAKSCAPDKSGHR